METTLSADGTRLAYDVRGDGPVLVYVTGAICFRQFRPVLADVKAFAAEFTVYTYDRRGRGDSGDTLPYSVDREIEDIEAIIDAAGGTAHIYGHSSGAVLALEAALRIPDKIDRVVIYDASYVHAEQERDSYSALSRKIGHLLERGENGRAIKQFLRGIGMPRPFVELLPLMPGWKTMKALAPTLMYDIAMTENLPPLDRLRGIKLPVQVTVGQRSPSSLLAVARAVAEAIPGAEYQVLDGQDHMVSPKALLPILTHALLKS
ncbi:alpha/beta fold hydrolase [Nocardia blacklockiae]|uniref:alpha/beta fold hydrolase n=1 Tax=Nocardia blacklockiae TaxID=480036 RepID=UPI001894245E|nr:alpha/beta hydrolase [Nocardia blacklockiae]MBF6172334.1 alpha/beta hydrolase [Nocardia blacklockiae]